MDAKNVFALPFEIRASCSRGGIVRFTAIRDGEAKAVATYAVGNKTRRTETATAWAADETLRNCKALSPEAVAAALLAKELEVATALQKADEEPERGIDAGARSTKKQERGPSQADRIVSMAGDVELFHSPGGDDAYARVRVSNHVEVWPINSRGFKRWLGRRFHEETDKAPNAEALGSALNVIAGKALFDGEEHQVHVRVAGDAGRIYIDLADAGWRTVEVTPRGWRILPSDECPVMFVRRKGMLPLPDPVPGGSIDDLRQFVNVGDDDQWRNLVGFIMATFRPTGPYPVLAVAGEQGSAKSTVCRFVRSIIDPNEAALRRPPRDERDIFIAASNAHVVAWDNVSSIPAHLSDAICALMTGAGFATRELYTNGEEAIFSGARPVLLNGISDVATRSDLLDRAVSLTLPTVVIRKTEADLNASFEAKRPGIIGAFLDAVSMGLANIQTLTLNNPPRMADFATWVVAAEPALPWESGAWLASYTTNRAATHEAAVESNPVATALMTFVTVGRTWEGTATDLLNQLESKASDAVKDRKDWPGTARGLSGGIRRIAPNLRAMGLDVRFDKTGRPRNRTITLVRTQTPSTNDGSSADRPHENAPGATENAAADGADGADGVSRLLSGPGGTDNPEHDKNAWREDLRDTIDRCDAEAAATVPLGCEPPEGYGDEDHGDDDHVDPVRET